MFYRTEGIVRDQDCSVTCLTRDSYMKISQHVLKIFCKSARDGFLSTG